MKASVTLLLSSGDVSNSRFYEQASCILDFLRCEGKGDRPAHPDLLGGVTNGSVVTKTDGQSC